MWLKWAASSEAAAKTCLVTITPFMCDFWGGGGRAVIHCHYLR